MTGFITLIKLQCGFLILKAFLYALERVTVTLYKIPPTERLKRVDRVYAKPRALSSLLDKVCSMCLLFSI